MGGQQTHFCRSISLLPNPQYNIRLLPYFFILTPSPLYPRKKEGSAILRSLQMMEQFYSPESLIVVVEGKRRKEQLLLQLFLLLSDCSFVRPFSATAAADAAALSSLASRRALSLVCRSFWNGFLSLSLSLPRSFASVCACVRGSGVGGGVPPLPAAGCTRSTRLSAQFRSILRERCARLSLGTQFIVK